MAIARASGTNGLRVGLFVALAGPLIGALLFLAGLAAVNGLGLLGQGGGQDGVMHRAGELSYAILLFGFVFGSVPAVLSGIAAAVMTAWRGGFSSRAAVVISLASALPLPLISLYISAGQRQAETPTYIGGLSLFYGLVAIISVISALICRWLLAWLGWIGSGAAAEGVNGD